MRRYNTYIIRFLAAAAALLVVLSAPDAAGQEPPEPPLRAEITDSGRRPVMVSLNMLGITSMHCNCSYTYGGDEAMWVFQSEPEIRAVDKDGPSHGKLKKGDVIVAIDGALITTRKGGIAFANLEAGEPVNLTVRRSGRTRDVVVVPQAIVGQTNSMPVPDVPALADVYKQTELAELARSVEELSKRSAELSELMESLEVPLIPDINININFDKMLPEGWVGFGLSFSGSIKDKDPGKPAEWRFNDPPTIETVQPGSPADKAGLQVGDELLEIDELKLDSRRGGDRFSRMRPGQVIEWKVRRGGKTFTVETTAGERPALETAYKAPGIPTPVESRPVRYTGTLAGAEIEVRGGDKVRVEIDEETGEIIIYSGDTVVRLKPKKKK